MALLRVYGYAIRRNLLHPLNLANLSFGQLIKSKTLLIRGQIITSNTITLNSKKARVQSSLQTYRIMLYNFTSYLPSYNLRFNRQYRRRAKFLLFKKSLSLKLLRLKTLKETIQVSKRNKTLIIKSVELDLALTKGADSDLTTLQKDNVSRLYNPRVMLVNSRIIISRNYGTKSYIAVITAVRKAIYSAFADRRSKSQLNQEKREPSRPLLPYIRLVGEEKSKLLYGYSRLYLS